MKTRNILSAAVIALTLSLTACGKKAASTPDAYEISGVKVSMPALQTAFVGANPDLTAAVNDVSSAIRYGQYMQAMQSLDKISTDPNLNDAQKKVVTEVLGQLKEVVSKAGASR
jgi:hypothetical protein